MATVTLLNGLLAQFCVAMWSALAADLLPGRVSHGLSSVSCYVLTDHYLFGF
jgi:hypothetical protein